MLPNLSALAATNTNADSHLKKDCVLVLGGVPYLGYSPVTLKDEWMNDFLKMTWDEFLDLPLNRVYKLLAEKRESVDVFVVDPTEWRAPNEHLITDHYRMTMQEFVNTHALEKFFEPYDHVAIIDDMKFGGGNWRLAEAAREEIVKSDEFTRLVDFAESRRGRVSWWEFCSAPSFKATKGTSVDTNGMRELNNWRNEKGEYSGRIKHIDPGWTCKEYRGRVQHGVIMGLGYKRIEAGVARFIPLQPMFKTDDFVSSLLLRRPPYSMEELEEWFSDLCRKSKCCGRHPEWGS